MVIEIETANDSYSISRGFSSANIPGVNELPEYTLST
jgi:hypothetical protein